jgi:molybdopterin-guanine dinucleotide biosynthesis protein A
MTGIETSVPHPAHTVLYGLVLAGGRGTRLGGTAAGHDKGLLDYHGEPQACWAMRLLAPFCARVYVSLRPDQAGAESYAGLPAVVDAVSQGPASGLAAAFALAPDAAWLVLAADMPLADPGLVAALVAARGRAPGAAATAFRGADGRLEPLCAIYEPRFRPVLEAVLAPAFAPAAGPSLRRLLEAAAPAVAEPPSLEALRSVNTPADDQAVRATLAQRRPEPGR